MNLTAPSILGISRTSSRSSFSVRSHHAKTIFVLHGAYLIPNSRNETEVDDLRAYALTRVTIPARRGRLHIERSIP